MARDPSIAKAIGHFEANKDELAKIKPIAALMHLLKDLGIESGGHKGWARYGLFLHRLGFITIEGLDEEQR